MSETFVPLDVFLLPPPVPGVQASPPMPVPVAVPEELEATLSAARRFRAALRDALDASLPPLLRAIAEEVVARELRIEPCAIAEVAAAALDRAADAQVVAIRVHPSECDAVAPLQLATIADAAIAPGDCSLELRSGTIASTLALRLEMVLAKHAP